MISRIGQWIVLFLLVGCVVMALFLVNLWRHAQERLEAPLNGTIPLTQAASQPQTTATLMMPDDKTGLLTPVTQSLILPQDQSTEALDILNRLIASWNASGSLHPVHATAGVDSVFLIPIPGHPNQQTAVVNFNAAFPQAQPSGIEPETLTLLSIIQTLHANIPSITQVRFLVNGQPRATLAGHADLTRTYMANIPVPGPQS